MKWNWEDVCEAATGLRRTSIKILWRALHELGFTNLPVLPTEMSHEDFGDYAAERSRQVAMAVLGRADASEQEVAEKIRGVKANRKP
jgi:hypothetical protein